MEKDGIQDAAETSPDVIGGSLEGLFIECGLSLLRALCGYVDDERRYGFWCQGTIFGCGNESHAWMIGSGAKNLRCVGRFRADFPKWIGYWPARISVEKCEDELAKQPQEKLRR